jgi:tRNA modification GTPase
MIRDDTIAAISTPAGRGGIGVVRLSGRQSLDLASHLFHAATPTFTPNLARFGRLVDPTTEEVIDEAILTYFKAPHSYTGEDVVELSCHGSPVILRRVLDILIAGGARIAEPGEFTFRAFLNRRLDLAQAQAVRDIINAQTVYQARVATRQLEGAFSKRLAPLKQALLDIIVQMESAVEFVEDDISPETTARLLARLQDLIGELKKVSSTFELGRFLKEGFDLAIVGRPNVGKSSVFNQLVGSDRAIVTAIPGTTRDALYESASIAGIPVRLIDTAGIRETDDAVERLGITRSRRAIADADIVLLVLDNSENLTEGDRQLLGELPVESRLVALNKSDLAQRLKETAGEALEDAVVISALTGRGLDRLREKIFQQLSGDLSIERDDILITDARQQQSVRLALEQTEEARDLIVEGELEEIILLKLHAALNALGDITGETLTDDILNQIFSTFCVGK